jgi:uncharacterized membrane protein
VQPVPVYRGWGQAGASRQTAGQAAKEEGEEELLHIFELFLRLFFVSLFVFLVLVLVFFVLVLVLLVFVFFVIVFLLVWLRGLPRLLRVPHLHHLILLRPDP